jgi:hypothetical protein
MGEADADFRRFFMTNPNSGVRTRVLFPEAQILQRTFYNGSLVGSVVTNRWPKYHWMADQINRFNRELKRRVPGFCQHIKIDKGPLLPVYVYQNGGVTVTEENPDRFTRDLGSYSAGQSPTGSPTDVKDKGYGNMIPSMLDSNRFRELCFDAWTTLKTQVPQDVQVLNFIYELKDFIPLGKRLAKAPRGSRDIASGTLLTAPLKGKHKIKKSAKAVNDTFLGFNFMWLPFVSDLKKLTQVSDNVAKRMKFLLQSKKKEVAIRIRKEDCYVHPLLNVDQSFGTADGVWNRRFVMTKYQCDFHVTAKLYQDLEGLDDAFAGLRATIAALGINNPVEAVWNAIPFSFLVDWVAPFGDWLERAAIQPFYGIWKVYDITTSVRERYDIEMRVGPYSGGGLSLPGATVETVHIDSYTRLVGLPQTLAAFDFSQLTSQQQKLFLSLVLTKVL